MRVEITTSILVVNLLFHQCLTIAGKPTERDYEVNNNIRSRKSVSKEIFTILCLFRGVQAHPRSPDSVYA